MHLPEALWKPEFCIPFQTGQVVMKEGEMGNTLHILMEGQVEVQIHDQVVGTFEPVEVFGEMAVIDSQPRSATVIAKTNCKLARIDQNRFKQLIQQRPDFGIDIMRMLVERIRWMDSVTANRPAPENPKTASAEPSPTEGLQKELEGVKTSLEALAGQIGQLLQKFKGP